MSGTLGCGRARSSTEIRQSTVTAAIVFQYTVLCRAVLCHAMLMLHRAAICSILYQVANH